MRGAALTFGDPERASNPNELVDLGLCPGSDAVGDIGGSRVWELRCRNGLLRMSGGSTSACLCSDPSSAVQRFSRDLPGASSGFGSASEEC